MRVSRGGDRSITGTLAGQAGPAEQRECKRQVNLLQAGGLWVNFFPSRNFLWRPINQGNAVSVTVLRERRLT